MTGAQYIQTIFLTSIGFWTLGYAIGVLAGLTRRV